MIGSGAIGSRSLGQAALPDFPSEWGGPRPAGAGVLAGSRRGVRRENVVVQPRR
jgi:hypothetical protein